MRKLTPVRWRAVLMLGIAAAVFAIVPRAMSAETPEERSQRMAWWREARFGMFIHFGIFSLPMNDPKGMDRYFTMSREEFVDLAPRFNPVRFDADTWARAAKRAGMRYMVIVTKSHDGWCLFDSKYADFDVMSTPYKHDILKDLTAACRREGLRLCFYYSIMDWHHPDYLPRRPGDRRSIAGADLDRYVVYMKNQLRELLTNYGPIGVLWFDGNWDKTWNAARAKDLYDYVRSLQPGIIINSRVDHPDRGDTAGDFRTPEQVIPTSSPPGVAWETCMTMNNHWQYIAYDQNWKPVTTLVRMLIECASKGGNFLLDVGPTPEGPMPQPAVERLEAIGRWLARNGESIYGTSAGPFRRQLAWGRATTKTLPQGETRLYLHVFDWPKDRVLRVPSLYNQPLGAHLLGDPNRTPLATCRDGPAILVRLPAAMPDPAASVVVLDVHGPADVRPISVAPGADRRITLRASDADIHGSTARYLSRPGVEAIAFWTDTNDWVSWPVRIEKPGRYQVEVVYGCEKGQGGGRYTVSIADQSLTATARDTGGWAKYVTELIGTLVVPHAGEGTVSVRLQSKPGVAVMDLSEVRLIPSR